MRKQQKTTGVEFDDVFKAEVGHLGLSAPNGVAVDNDLNGLALSGGGIRSATFALGIVQALVRAGLLEKFHYLSTVSGGGYTGGMLSWYLSEKMDEQRRTESTAPRPAERASELGDEAAEKKRAALPGRFGVDANSFPFGTGAPGDQIWQRSLLRFLRQHGNYLTPGAGVTALSLIAVVLRGMLLNFLVWAPLVTLFFVLAMPWLQFASFSLAKAAAGLFVLACVAYSLLARWASWGEQAEGDASAGRDSYRWRRAFEKSSPWLLSAAAAGAVFFAIPWLHSAVKTSLPTVGSVVSVIGAASGFLVRDGSKKWLPASVIGPIGAALLVGGLVLAAYGIAAGVDSTDEKALLIALAAVSVVTGWFVNLNHIGVQRYYRDRLMETFQPDLSTALDNATGRANRAEGLRLTQLGNRSLGNRPYHLVNTNVVLVDSANRTFRTRGGDNFVLSREYCGSRATRYIPTPDFTNGRLPLATAVAISGAAVNPNTGVAGAGLTRSRAVSLLLSLLNLRLGYWVENPSRPRKAGRSPNHFGSFLYEIASRYHERSSFLQLTDGGHFENLGLYELVQRRCKTILVVDGGADPEFQFGDLQNAIRLVETDFQVRVDFPVQLLTPLIPALPQPYPPGGTIKTAMQGWARGTIAYQDGTKSQLFYVTTTFVDGLALDVNGYKAQHSEFPDEPTADQFFDQHQFEAYRELGMFIGEQVLGAGGLAKAL